MNSMAMTAVVQRPVTIKPQGQRSLAQKNEPDTPKSSASKRKIGLLFTYNASNSVTTYTRKVHKKHNTSEMLN